MSEIESTSTIGSSSNALIISIFIFAFNTYYTIKKTFLVMYAYNDLKNINDKLETINNNLDKKLNNALQEIQYLKTNMNNIIKYNLYNKFDKYDNETEKNK